MSQNAGALTPSRGNRRFIILAIVLGLLGAGLVYVATSRGSSSTASGDAGGAANVPVVVAKSEIPARTVITQSMVEVKLFPADSVSTLAFGDTGQVVGQVTRFPLTAGEQVLSTKIVSLSGESTAVSRSLSFVIPEGQRGFAINASQVQNAGGLVLPGDYVDIIILYDVEFERTPGDPDSAEIVESYLVQTLMQNVEVLAVQQTVVDVVEASIGAGGATALEGSTAEGSTSESATTGDGAEPEGAQRVRNSEASPIPEAVTVTLSLTPEEAQRLYVAEANGRIRLAVRPFGDSETLPIDYETKLELIPQDLPNPFEVLR